MKTLRNIAIEIEQFRAALGRLMLGGAARPSSLPTVVYAFDDRKAIEPFLPLHEGKPASLGGYCHCGSGSDVSFIALTLEGYQDSSRIVFHEYTHLFVHNALPFVPVWLSEGLAEYYSTFYLADDHLKATIGRAYGICAFRHHTSTNVTSSVVSAPRVLWSDGVGHSSRRPSMRTFFVTLVAP